MSEHDVTAAGTPLSDEEIEAVSGAGRLVPVYRVVSLCLVCGETNTVLTEDPVDYQSTLFNSDFSCPGCKNGNRVYFQTTTTKDHDIYYKN